MGQASVTPGVTSATSTRRRASSTRRASEHAPAANPDPDYGPVPQSVNRPRVPTAPKGSSPTPRAVARPHSEKIFHIATPHSRAHRPPSADTPHRGAKAAAPHLAHWHSRAAASQEKDRQKTGRSHPRSDAPAQQ